MNNGMNDLFKNIYDHSDQADMIRVLEEIELNIFKKNTKIDDYLQNKIPQALGKDLNEYIVAQKIDIYDAISLSKFIADIKKALMRVAVMDLYLSFDPSRETVKMFGEWLGENMSSKVILRIHTNPELLGGAIVEFNGLRKDYSLNFMLKEKFNKNYGGNLNG